METGFPWIAVLPLALIPWLGGSAEGLQRLLLLMEMLFLLLAVRRPVWVLAALLVSEFTIGNYMLLIGDLSISSRLIITLVSLPIVAPHVLSRPDLGPNARAMLAMAFAFIVLTTVANSIAADDGYVFQFLRYIATGVIVLALVPAVVRSRDDLRDLGLVVLTVVAVSAVVAILQHYHFKGAPVYQAVPHPEAPANFAASQGRSLGLSENPIYLTNTLLVVGMALLGVILMGPLRPGTRGFMTGALLTLALALYFTFTRSWTLSAGFALLAMALLYRGRFRRELWLLVLLAPLLFWYWSDYQGNRYSQGPSSDSSAAGRPVLWTVGLNIALENPILGVGHNQFLELSPEFANTVSDDLLERQGAGAVLGTYTPHNDFLNIWLSFGTLALFLYIGMLALAVKNFIQAFFKAADPLLKGLALGSLGALIAYSVNSLFHNYFDSTLTLWVLMGLSLALTKLISVEPARRGWKWAATTA